MPAVEICFSFSMANLLLVMFRLDEYLLLAKVWHRQWHRRLIPLADPSQTSSNLEQFSIFLTTSVKIALHKLADCTAWPYP